MNFPLPTKKPFIKYSLSPIPKEYKKITDIDCVGIILKESDNLIVKEGDIVKIGQPLISQPYFGAFASVCGSVEKIIPWYDERGLKFKKVILKKIDKEEFFKLFDPSEEPLTLKSDEIIKRLSILGITNIKENIPFLIMGVDDDIGKVTNRFLMEHFTERVLEGIGIIKKAFPNNKFLFAVSKDAKNRLTQSISNKILEGIEIVEIKSQYPYTFLPFIISLLKEDKVTVISCKTVLAIREALKCGYLPPVQLVSVQISKKAEPLLFEFPLGTTISQILRAIQVKIINGTEIIIGGEMRGTTIWDLGYSLTSKDDSILIRYPNEISLAANEHCINCGRCSNVCPVGLRVDLISKAVEFSVKSEVVRLGANSCIRCGLCDSVCIVKRPLLHLIVSGIERYIKEGNFNR